jgi:hypothetical protein
MSTPKKKITKKQMKSVKAGQAIKLQNKVADKKPPVVSIHYRQG